MLSAEGKYNQAVEQLQEELQVHPQNGAAALELAKVYTRAGEHAEAEQQFRIVVEAQPKNAEAHYAFGSLLIHEKKYPDAHQELLRRIKLTGDVRLLIWLREGKDYGWGGKLDTRPARDEATKIIESLWK